MYYIKAGYGLRLNTDRGRGARARKITPTIPIARKRASYPRAARLDAEESGMALSIKLARISHRFLLNSYNWLDNKELWGSAKYGLSLR